METYEQLIVALIADAYAMQDRITRLRMKVAMDDAMALNLRQRRGYNLRHAEATMLYVLKCLKEASRKSF